ncbi:MAG: hypothetical protein WHV67_00885 [Thermoanaerobaculia bacterium]
MIRKLFLIYLLFCGLVFPYTPEKIEITANASKIPTKRSQMRIDFTARAIYGFYENVSFYFASDNITTIEIFPSNPIILDENGISGYGIINLDMQDTLYKVYLIIKSNEEILGSTYFYFKNEQGNALKLTEGQYLKFSEEKKQMWMNSQAEEHAKADLDALRAKGLQIAVEKWPKEGERFIPLENNIGDTLEIMDNSLYEIKLTEKAIQDPAYKDIVKIELQPPDGGPSYYANFTTNQDLIMQPLCLNLLVELKIGVRLYNPYSGLKRQWGDIPLNARITYSGVVQDKITGNCIVKTFAKDVMISQNLDYNDPFYMDGTVIITVSLPPSGNYPIKDITLYTYNDKVRTGSCDRSTDISGQPECFESHPEWINGSENVKYFISGSWDSNAMIRNIRCTSDINLNIVPECKGFKENPNDPLHLRHYLSLVTATNYSSFAQIKVEKIPLFWTLNGINEFWTNNVAMEQRYIDYRACPADFAGAGSFHHVCTETPIIAIDEDECFYSGVPSHETGHWLQFRMQNNQKAQGVSGEDCSKNSSLVGAFSEGFAEWHEKIVNYSKNQEIARQKSEGCNLPYDNYYYHVQIPLLIRDFFWDLFDSIDDQTYDRLCFYQGFGCFDPFSLDLSEIKKWIGHQYDTIWQFIHGFPPLQCNENDNQCKCKVCKLLNSQGLMNESQTQNCFNLICQ